MKIDEVIKEFEGALEFGKDDVGLSKKIDNLATIALELGLAALKDQKNGFVSVPSEPTQAMIEEFAAQANSRYCVDFDAYSAMEKVIDEAPQSEVAKVLERMEG